MRRSGELRWCAPSAECPPHLLRRAQVEAKTSTDVECKVLDGGLFGSRRHLNVVGTSANLPAITEKDWEEL